MLGSKEYDYDCTVTCDHCKCVLDLDDFMTFGLPRKKWWTYPPCLVVCMCPTCLTWAKDTAAHAWVDLVEDDLEYESK